MATLAVQNFGTVGLAPVFSAADALGDKYPNVGGTYLFVKNAGATPVTVTINSIKPCDQGFDHDEVLTVAGSETKQIGPLAPARFNDATSLASVAYSAVTDITVAVVRV